MARRGNRKKRGRTQSRNRVASTPAANVPPSKTEAFERLEEAAHSNPHISQALARTLNELKGEGVENIADLDAKAKALFFIKRDLKVAKLQPGAVFCAASSLRANVARTSLGVPRDPSDAFEAPTVAEEFAS